MGAAGASLSAPPSRALSSPTSVGPCTRQQLTRQGGQRLARAQVDDLGRQPAAAEPRRSGRTRQESVLERKVAVAEAECVQLPQAAEHLWKKGTGRVRPRAAVGQLAAHAPTCHTQALTTASGTGMWRLVKSSRCAGRTRGRRWMGAPRRPPCSSSLAPGLRR